jgi:hypothetical protein
MLLPLFRTIFWRFLLATPLLRAFVGTPQASIGAIISKYRLSAAESDDSERMAANLK